MHNCSDLPVLFNARSVDNPNGKLKLHQTIYNKLIKIPSDIPSNVSLPYFSINFMVGFDQVNQVVSLLKCLYSHKKILKLNSTINSIIICSNKTQPFIPFTIQQTNVS